MTKNSARGEGASQVALVVKNLPVSAGDITHVGLIPVSEDPWEEEMATHSSILAWKNSMNRGARWATVHGVAESQTRLSK